MTDYPSTLPCPQIEGYRVETDFGISRVQFEHGNVRQRRSVESEVNTFSLSLVLSIRQLWEWQSWANMYGYEWHWMSLESHYSSFGNGVLIPHYIRYIGDISIEAIDADYVRVSFQAESDVDTLPQGVVIKTRDWIIGGTPPAPSPNWIIARTPSNPSTDNVIAGSPGSPAA